MEGAEELGPGSAFRGEQPLSPPQSSLPGQWRWRRNSLVVVTKHQNMSTKNDNVCLESTGDNAYPKPTVAVQQLDDVVDVVCSTAFSLGNLMV